MAYDISLGTERALYCVIQFDPQARRARTELQVT
jgi:hypothetical protein